MRVQQIVPTALLLAAVAGFGGCSDDDTNAPVPTATGGAGATATRTATTGAPNTPTRTATLPAPPPTSTSVPIPPTATAVATATEGPVDTPTQTAGATESPTAGEDTSTPTPTATEGVATPTETSTPSGGGLGVRAFTVTRPGSALHSSALGGFDVSRDPWIPGVLQLEAGVPDEAGVASLRLIEDVILGSFVADDSIACAKLFAAGSAGTLSCNGGVPQSVVLSQDSHGDESPGPIIIQLAQGDASPAGSASFTLTRSDVNLPFGSSLNDCLTADFSVTTPGVFTTDVATARVENAAPTGDTIELISSEVPGLHPEPFDCADWTNAGGPGRLSGPVVGLDVPPVGDVANIFFLAGREPLD